MPRDVKVTACVAQKKKGHSNSDRKEVKFSVWLVSRITQPLVRPTSGAKVRHLHQPHDSVNRVRLRFHRRFQCDVQKSSCWEKWPSSSAPLLKRQKSSAGEVMCGVAKKRSLLKYNRPPSTPNRGSASDLNILGHGTRDGKKHVSGQSRSFSDGHVLKMLQRFCKSCRKKKHLDNFQ